MATTNGGPPGAGQDLYNNGEAKSDLSKQPDEATRIEAKSDNLSKQPDKATRIDVHHLRAKRW